MNIVSGVVLFVLIWWTVLFCTLPFGRGAPTARVPGTTDAPPEHPYLRQKIIATTVISALLWAPAAWVITHQAQAFRDNARDMRVEDQSR